MKVVRYIIYVFFGIIVGWIGVWFADFGSMYLCVVIVVCTCILLNKMNQLSKSHNGSSPSAEGRENAASHHHKKGNQWDDIDFPL